jgi:hypothetical protein
MLVNFVPREGHASEGSGKPQLVLKPLLKWAGGKRCSASSAPAANLWSLNTLTDHEVQDNLRYNT